MDEQAAGQGGRGWIRIALGVWIWSCVYVSGQCVAQVRDSELIEAAAKASRSSVCVFGPGGQGGGSGVIISADGFALTNYHVIESCREFTKCGLADGNLYDAVIVGVDPTGDLALIQLLGREDFVAAEIADSDEVKMGDACFAVGNPFLLATDFQPSVSFGIVSGTHRYQYPSGTLLEYTDCIQTDAAINPGNSGGGLFDAQGRLIGINGRGSFEKRQRINVGVGYAISSNQTRLFLDHLKAGRIVDHATAGLTVITGNDGRPRVDNILPNSFAYQQGVRYGDTLLKMNQRAIRSVNQFKNLLGILPKGYPVKMEFQRDGVKLNVEGRLDGVHGEGELQRLVSGETGGRTPPTPSQRERWNLSRPEFAQYYEFRPGFVNAYFNRQQLERVMTRGFDPEAEVGGGWKMTGTDSEGSRFELVLRPESAGLQWQDEVLVWDSGADAGPEAAATGTGLLRGLVQYGKLRQGGAEKVGDTFYLGTLPFGEPARPHDTLVSRVDGLRIYWFFEPVSGDLAGLEVDEQGATTEIRFPDGAPHRPNGNLRMDFRQQTGPWVSVEFETVLALGAKEQRQ